MYLREGKNKNIWYVVLRVNGKDKPISLRTEDRVAAASKARQLDSDYLTGKNDGTVSKLSFDNAVDWYFESTSFDIDEVEKNTGRYRQVNKIINERFKPAFKNKDMLDFNDRDIQLYQSNRKQNGLSGSSFNNEMSLLRAIFNAVVPEYMDFSDIPKIKNTSLEDQQEGQPWETYELRQIILEIWRERKKWKHPDRIDNWFNFYSAIMILMATGARPSSLWRVRLNNVQLVNGRYRIFMFTKKGRAKNGKKGKSAFIAVQRFANRAIKNLLEYHKNKNSKPNDLLIKANSNDYYDKRFYKLIVRMGIELNGVGIPRRIYSIRHSYITRMMARGVDQTKVAKNTLTSIQMIAIHYDKTGAIDFEDELH